MDVPKNIVELLNFKALPVPKSVFKIDLFEIKPEHGNFEKFLISNRFRCFHTLVFLQILDKNDEFIIGYENLKFSPICYEDEQVFLPEDYKDFKNFFLDKIFSSEELFNSLVADLEILQLEATDLLKIKTENQARDIFSKNGYSHDVQGRCFFLKNQFVAVTDDAIYVEDEELFIKVKSLINTHNKEFDLFLKKNLLKASHDIYVSWLLNWFPGRIHVRSLE